MRVAYLANQYPCPVEPYVKDEIAALRQRGIEVVSGSVRQPQSSDGECPMVCLQPLQILKMLAAAILAVRHWRALVPILTRILLRGNERLLVRLKAILHTWLGAYYALLLQGRDVDHIHVHHGYFGAWIAMVAARVLEVPFSMTLHGSDLLLHGAFLDVKLEACSFCITISEYNRRHILERFPHVDPKKILVLRLGVDVPERDQAAPERTSDAMLLLAVGRLHAVKDHAFLLRACARLRDQQIAFRCLIAGDGPERRRLESLIRDLGLEAHVALLGHVPPSRIGALYARADLVVLTSRSEGIPLVLMEAMARGRIVLAPAITGIPELVLPGENGFLYQPGCLEEFVARVVSIQVMMRSGDAASRDRLENIRDAARLQVLRNFHRARNLDRFCERFLELAGHQPRSHAHANPVLQQVQLSVQRN